MSTHEKQFQFQKKARHVIFTEGLFNAPVSDPAFRILTICLSYRTGTGLVALSNAEIGRLCVRKSGKAMSRANAGRYLQELVDNGYLRKRDDEFYLMDDVLLNQQHETGDVVEPTTLSKVDVVEPTTISGDGVVEPTTLSKVDVVVSTTKSPTGTKKGDREESLPEHIYIASLNNISNDSINCKKNIKIKDTAKNDPDFVDEFTRERFPNAPCSVGLATTYFERFFSDRKVEGVNPENEALDFFEYWENKRNWSKIPKGRSTPVRLSSWNQVRPHATYWARKASEKPGKPKTSHAASYGRKAGQHERRGASSVWMTPKECYAHAKKFNLTATAPEFYESNGKKGQQARFRFRGFINKSLNS